MVCGWVSAGFWVVLIDLHECVFIYLWLRWFIALIVLISLFLGYVLIAD